MRYLFESEEEEKETLGRKPASRGNGLPTSDTEITLGTRSILGIFFGLVLVCGIFFGLGYTVGRGSSARPVAEVAPVPANSGDGSRQAKPSAAEESLSAVPPAAADGAPDTSADAAPASSGSTDGSASPASVAAPATAAGSSAVDTRSTPPPTVKAAAASPAGQPTVDHASAVTTPAAAPVLQRASMVQAAPVPGAMVQIAAVRVPEDATILVKALQKRGFSAVVRNDPRDQLLHVQIGPFTTRSEANAMRARLLASGYNAVLK